MLKEKIQQLFFEGPLPNQEELAELLALKEEQWDIIYHEADKVRRQQAGDQVQIRAIIEFSNYCKRRCAYCGLNAGNPNMKRYRMRPEHIVDTAIEGWNAGYRTAVLQSGEDPWYTPEILGQIVTEIKGKTGMAVTLSCGEMPKEAYAYLRRCGTDRYLLKQETADDTLYANLHPDGTLAKRVGCLKTLKALGYETGSGFMIGLPGQTLHIIAKDLLLLAEIPCDMAGIGPFIPHPDTPLRRQQKGSPVLTKKAVALARLLLKKVNLPATTSLGVIDSRQKNDIFSCGANVVMRKITPPDLRSLYEIYPVEYKQIRSVKEEREELERQIRSLDRIPV